MLIKKILKNKINTKISINHGFAICAILIGFIITLFVGKYADGVQSDIANNILRLHVIANSDSEFDQNLKLEIRDAIIKEMTSKFKDSKDIIHTREIAKVNLSCIEKIAQDIIKESGKEYEVKVSIDNSFFPTKQYGDMSFPAGIYQAVKVEIGEAKGQNWWCVLFPPLCFVDATNGTVPESSKSKLRESLSQEEYSLLTSNSEEELEFKVKFKSVEVWQSSKQKVQVALDKIF